MCPSGHAGRNGSGRSQSILARETRAQLVGQSNRGLCRCRPRRPTGWHGFPVHVLRQREESRRKARPAATGSVSPEDGPGLAQTRRQGFWKADPSALDALRTGHRNVAEGPAAVRFGESSRGATSRTRTDDLRFTKPLLYQLSYRGSAETPALRLSFLKLAQPVFVPDAVQQSIQRAFPIGE